MPYKSLLNQLPQSSAKQGWPWTEETDPAIYQSRTDWPKISIVTPSFNQGQFIEETIRSILLQNYPNLEYIIIDGGSTDNTVEVIKQYEPWITYWVSEKDAGQSDALNKGLKKCTGSIFNWINSDDTLENMALFHVATAFMQNETATVVTGIQEILSYPSLTSIWVYGIQKHATLEEQLLDPFYAQQATFFSLDQLPRPLNESFNYCMDLDMWVKYLLHNGLKNVHFITEKLAIFKVHESSKTGADLPLFTLDAYAIERLFLDNHRGGWKKIFSYYIAARLQRSKKPVVLLPQAYPLTNINIDFFSKVWAHREIKRAHRFGLSWKEKFWLSLIYWKYCPYKNSTAIKCWLFDILFPPKKQ